MWYSMHSLDNGVGVRTNRGRSTAGGGRSLNRDAAGADFTHRLFIDTDDELEFDENNFTL